MAIYLHQLRQFVERFPWTIRLVEILRTLRHELLNFVCHLLKLFHLFLQLLQMGNFLLMLVTGIREALGESVHLGLQESGGGRICRLHKLLHLDFHG